MTGSSLAGPPDGPAHGAVCRDRGYDHPDAARLVQALYDEQVARYGCADPAETSPGQYTPPGGLFLVACGTGTPVGCGGYRTYDPGARIAEIKKMYVVPHLRGQGIGRLILSQLEQRAAEAGFAGIILETGVRNDAALGLYASAGYQIRPRYAAGFRDPAVNRAFAKPLPHPSRPAAEPHVQR